MERKNAWKSCDEAKLAQVNALCTDYIKFISDCKTERECVEESIRLAEAAGYKNLNDCIEAGTQLKAGDKVYANNMGKTIALFVVGTEPMEKGMHILGAHIDSPRIHVKLNPLYQHEDFALLDTHYYGGIKKNQWVALPLALHGVVAKKDGTVVNVVIGEDPSDPVLGISDLLIHLSGDQMAKTLSKAIEGEKLNLTVGSRPVMNAADDCKEPVKELILSMLKEKYDIEEEDFLSAELEIVPAGPARDYGLDRSMIAAYGQDDRVCAYTSLAAMLEMEETPKRTGCCLLVDKEEIGSVGATGMQSRFFENSVAELLDGMGCYSELALRRALRNSSMLSSDVSAGYDPAYGEAFEKKNAAYLGRGIVLNKFTGARGKSGSNDANAEYVARVRRIFDDHNVAFQTAELGKVDFGGGGTIAYIAALYGMEVIDSGVAVLSMHAPWEVTSKADVYEAYKAYKAFLLDA